MARLPFGGTHSACVCRSFVFLILTACSLDVYGQGGVVGDVLAGNLIKPEKGQWAWYDVLDADGARRHMMREAVVGTREVDGKTGYWLEIEVLPAVGYRSVYKMLVTGPANDPANVHEVIVREGMSEPVKVPLPENDREIDEDTDTHRESLGTERIETPGGTFEAEHVVLTTRDHKVDLWINDDVRPMGVVRMVGTDGQLVLRGYGTGGQSAESVIDKPPLEDAQRDPRIEVHTGEDGGDAAEPAERSPRQGNDDQ